MPLFICLVLKKDSCLKIYEFFKGGIRLIGPLVCLDGSRKRRTPGVFAKYSVIRIFERLFYIKVREGDGAFFSFGAADSNYGKTDSIFKSRIVTSLNPTVSSNSG